MKTTLVSSVALILALSLASCKKDNPDQPATVPTTTSDSTNKPPTTVPPVTPDTTKPPPTAPTVTATALADLKAGSTINFFQVDLAATAVTAPVAGENQTWDFSKLADRKQFSTVLEAPASNASFSSATYMQSSVDSLGSGTSAVAVASKSYYEFSADGWALLGRVIPETVLNYSAVSGKITFPAQAVPTSQKLYDPKFPLHYNDSASVNNVTQNTTFKLDIPLLKLNNAPGSQKATIDYGNKVMAWGKLQLKGYTTPLDVLVVRSTYTTKMNYFLNGLPASAALLSVIGQTDGATTTLTTYKFFSATIGYVGEIIMNRTGTAVAEANFRKNL
jgi:hypothetical protein